MFISLKDIVKKFKLNLRGVIHIGAHKGEELFSYYQNDVKNIILIEANKDLIQHLKFKKFLFNFFSLKIDIFNFAAYHDSLEEIDLFITSNTQSSSILKLKKHKELYPDIIETKKNSIPAKRVDEIFNKNLNIQNYNFINIDIQGAELQALKGCSKILNNIDAIYTEINFDELYENCTLVENLDNFLIKYGFIRVITDTPQHESWGDALYIKKQI